MSEGIEALLRQALAPVEPPADLEWRLEERLSSLVDAAAGELETLDVAAMKDPRNWVRPVVAAVVGSGAAVGLVLVRTRRNRQARRDASSNPLDLAERTVRDLRKEAGRLLDDARRR
jgi:hypothetical protein